MIAHNAGKTKREQARSHLEMYNWKRKVNFIFSLTSWSSPQESPRQIRCEFNRTMHAAYYTVSQKNVPPLACYNFDAHEWILIFFGRNITDKIGNQKTLYYATSNNLCFCTTWQNGETRKSHISLNWIVLHTQCTCVLSSWKKKNVICDVFDSV